MKQNVVKKNVAKPKSNKGLELTHGLGEIEQLKRELQAEINERKVLEKKLTNRKQLQELVLCNFPGAKIFVFDPDFKDLLSEGKSLDPPFPFDADLIGKLRKSFDGESVHCEIHF